MPRTMPLIFTLLVGFGLSSAVYAGPTAPAMPDSATLSKECYATVGPVLQSADGKLTPEVRNAYLGWAEKTVLQELRESGQSVSADCLAAVKPDGTLRDAIFGSVYPPSC